MRACGQQAQHPDEEEVVWNHSVHLCKPDSLDADSLYDLLVGEGAEEFAGDDLWSDWGAGAEFAEHNVGRKDEGDGSCDGEG